MLSEISLKKRLNSVGDRQLPCGTPVLVTKVVEIDCFQVTWKVLSSRKFLTQLRRSVGSPALASLNIIPCRKPSQDRIVCSRYFVCY